MEKEKEKEKARRTRPWQVSTRQKERSYLSGKNEGQEACKATHHLTT